MKKTQMKRKTLLISIVALLTIISYFTIIGIQNYDLEEPEFKALADNDADGVINLIDNCPNTINPDQENFDGDKFGDICDFDDDNDGIVNAIDAFALNTEEWDDFDFDGIGANEDTDDDNDGILDSNDFSPSLASTQLTTKYIDLVENCAIMDPGFPRQLCYGDFFESLIDKGESSADVMDLAYSFAKLGAIDDCHFTTHHLGYAAFEKNPDITDIIINANPTCRNGFYHGALSAFFDNLKQEGKDISNWHKVYCDKFVDTEKHQPCLHGIGHGLVFYYGDDLKSSVDACHELPDEPLLNNIPPDSKLTNCINGVMMQYNDNQLTKSTSFEEDIPGICSKIELIREDSLICYSQLGQVLAFKTNHDQLKAKEFCNLFEKPLLKINCVLGFMQEIEESKISLS